ncbi:MAG: zinc-ribbon domain-containing protein [Planctomycetes bacterium]|nr:zinc-ribbon domain-containing protein [Planctomycetota bacterium]
MFFLIFGLDNSKKQAGDIVTAHCHHCHNDSNWGVWKETLWGSLFFVKVVPVTSKYYVACQICGHACKINSSMAKRVIGRREASGEVKEEMRKLIDGFQSQE